MTRLERWRDRWAATIDEVGSNRLLLGAWMMSTFLILATLAVGQLETAARTRHSDATTGRAVQCLLDQLAQQRRLNVEYAQDNAAFHGYEVRLPRSVPANGPDITGDPCAGFLQAAGLTPSKVHPPATAGATSTSTTASPATTTTARPRPHSTTSTTRAPSSTSTTRPPATTTTTTCRVFAAGLCVRSSEAASERGSTLTKR